MLFKAQRRLKASAVHGLEAKQLVRVLNLESLRRMSEPLKTQLSVAGLRGDRSSGPHLQALSVDAALLLLAHLQQRLSGSLVRFIASASLPCGQHQPATRWYSKWFQLHPSGTTRLKGKNVFFEGACRTLRCLWRRIQRSTCFKQAAGKTS